MTDTTEMDERFLKALERIADALEVRTETDRQGMEMASSFTDFIKLVIKTEGRPLHHVGVPPTVGDEPICRNCMDFIECSEKKGFDPLYVCEKYTMVIATYDPEDDTFATGKECPNCGEEKHIERHNNGPEGMEKHFHCDECHHIWPYVLAKDRS